MTENAIEGQHAPADADVTEEQVTLPESSGDTLGDEKVTKR